LAFIVSLVAITGYAVSNGNPYAMITPFDSNGNKCGMKDQGADKKIDFTDYKYKYFYNLRSMAESAGAGSVDPTEWFKSECVKKCPA